MSSTEPVNLTNCDREPIHIPGSIQRHGAMLVCDPESYQLLFASRNITTLIGFSGELRRGMPLTEIIGDKAAHDVRNAAAKSGTPGLAGIALGVRFPDVAGDFDVKVHTYENRAFIEIERCADNGRGAQQALDLTHNLIHRIGLESSVQSIAKVGAKLVRAMLGYDRVMIYQFLHNGAGRVIAEAKSPARNSFMGQHFPASDIPYQARRLYLLNTIRMITDSSYVPIPLEPPLAAGEAPIDMSFAQLRSVSPIHCEYLRNMGVVASLSISIIVDGELWGLISCHHDSPKITPLSLRIAAELFGHYFSLQIALADRRATMLAANHARAQLDNIVTNLSADGTVAQQLTAKLENFASLINCSGAGLWMDGIWSTTGDALDKGLARRLMDMASAEAPRSIWSTQELRVHCANAGTAVAGVLAIPISVTLGDYLMLFRNEEAHDIQWAGEPIKNLVSTPSGNRLTPRGSFETWLEEVRGRSMPWTEADMAVAEAIRTYLRDVILRQSEASAEERARTEQRRRILNDELNHRVKNIIALVKSIAIQTGSSAANVADYSTALEGRLRALAFAHDQSLGGTRAGDMATLIEAEAGLYRHSDTSERLSIDGMPVQLGDRAFSVLALVIHEMMTNAAKYGAFSVPTGRLEVRWHLSENGDCELEWIESDGPAVCRPSRDGFGTKLIRSTMEYDLGGSAVMDYAPAGVRARFVIPATHINPAATSREKAEPPEVFEKSLAGLSILIVEDQGLIAMDAEETLRQLGAEDIRLSPTVKDAAQTLETYAPDAVILDFNLGDETSEAIAEILIARRVPFVFTTGYSDSVMIPPRFRDIPIVRKPVNGTSLAAQLGIASHRLAENSGTIDDGSSIANPSVSSDPASSNRDGS